LDIKTRQNTETVKIDLFHCFQHENKSTYVITWSKIYILNLIAQYQESVKEYSSYTFHLKVLLLLLI